MSPAQTLHRASALCLGAVTFLALSACGGGGSDSDTQTEKALCFDNGIYTAGTTVSLEYAETGFAVGSRSETSKVLSTNATFNNSAGLIERHVTISGTAVRGDTNYSVVGNFLQYESLRGLGVVANHGMVASGRFGQQRTVAYNPPYEDRRTELNKDQEGTFTALGVDTSTGSFPAGPTPFTRKTQVKFVGVELLSLPAGSYKACRYDVRVDDGPISREWLYRGVLVRQERQNATDIEVLELKSGALNGVPL